MAIRFKNLADWSETINIPFAAAVASTTAGRAGFLAPFTGYLVGYFATWNTLGVDGTGSPTQNVVVDILQNGSSIFTSGNANKINWLHTALTLQPSSYGVLTADPLAITVGDAFEAQILQVLNGTSPTQPIGLSIMMLFSRREYSPVAATVTGTTVFSMANAPNY